MATRVSSADVDITVIFSIPVIYTADHCQNLASVGADGDDASITGVMIIFFEIIDVFDRDFLGFFIQVKVNRGINFQATPVDQIKIVNIEPFRGAFQLFPNVNRKVGGNNVVSFLDFLDLHLFSKNCISFCLANGAFFHHTVQGNLLASFGLFGTIDGVEVGELRNGGQYGTLGFGKGADRLVKINARCRINTVGQITIKVSVEIPLQNLILLKAARNFKRQNDLFEFAGVRSLIAFLFINQNIFYKLLSNGTPTLDAFILQVLHKSPANTFGVYARILIEGLVFQNNCAFPTEFRNII